MSTFPAGPSRPTAQRPRPAATIVLLRDTDHEPEVLMLRRHGGSGFAAGAWVFPGGAVDDADRRVPRSRIRGVDPAALEARFADDADAVLGFHVAAVRETFEEAGLLFADGPVDPSARRATRVALVRRDAPEGLFARFLAEQDLVLRLDALTYLSRWITPKVEGRRFDTVFFLAVAPPGQEASHDEIETTARRWVRARPALSAHRAGAFPMIHPTVQTLEWLVGRRCAADALRAAAARDTVPWILPHVVRRDDGGVDFLHPGDPAFPRELYADELRGPTA